MSNSLEYQANLKLLGDTLEGLIGAILVDSGFDIDVCRKLYADNILPYVEKYCHGPHNESQNPKDLLHKFMAQRKCQHFRLRRDGLNAETNNFGAGGKSSVYTLIRTDNTLTSRLT
jgi:dsRNA-specific ribonuclease